MSATYPEFKRSQSAPWLSRISRPSMRRGECEVGCWLLAAGGHAGAGIVPNSDEVKPQTDMDNRASNANRRGSKMGRAAGRVQEGECQPGDSKSLGCKQEQRKPSLKIDHWQPVPATDCR
ncbi:hypothetical protein FA13DRAFT_1714928 [Coprinellus micaceus]|uniref:Uncharacterized protein n=1 Tax=Coprinellus micaceus TaxID=71717 RepID=A0A4Y7SRV9_COPMI|nr:hypothetical protein FA13DRAFT_1714928 [Coprinellus micaceus]